MDLQLLSPTDKPALLAIGNPEALATSKFVLNELDYKIHVAGDPEDFLNRFSQIHYQIVILDELFGASVPAENTVLRSLQVMPMSQRRHATIFLLGDSFQTLNKMQAYHQSVHAVVNRSDLASLGQIIQQVAADQNLFLNVYRETQLRMAQGKA